jgi:hypothetical protein
VLLDTGVFLVGQPAGLVENAVRNTGLAQVVVEPGQAQFLEIPPGQTERNPKGRGQHRDVDAVCEGVGIVAAQLAQGEPGIGVAHGTVHDRAHHGRTGRHINAAALLDGMDDVAGDQQAVVVDDLGRCEFLRHGHLGGRGGP